MNPKAHNTSLSYRKHFIHYKVLEDIKYCSDLILIMTWFLNPKEFNIPVLLPKLKYRHADFTPRERESISPVTMQLVMLLWFISSLEALLTNIQKKEPHSKIHQISESKVDIPKEEKIFDKLTWWIFYN